MANFMKNFKNQNMNKGFISQSILDQLNDKYENMNYVYYDDGGYVLQPKEKNIQITFRNFSIDNIEEIEKACGKSNLTQYELANYAYNSQKKIYMTPKEDFKHLFGNREVDIEDLFIFNEGTRMKQLEKIVLIPEQMHGETSIKISNGKKEYLLKLERKPMNSLYTWKFETIKDSEIHFEMFLNNKKGDIEFNIKPGHVVGRCAKEYLENLKFIETISNNDFYINDVKVKIESKKNENKTRKTLISIWEKIVELEEFLKIKFEIKKYELTHEDLLTIYILYETLIKEKTVISYDKIYDISYDFSNVDEDMIESLNGEQEGALYFEIQEEYEANLFSMKKTFYGIRGFFNLYIKETERNDKEEEYIIHFEEKKDKEMFNGLRLYLTEEKVKEFMENKTHIKVLNSGVHVISEIKNILNEEP